jgi:hypothetical protein
VQCGNSRHEEIGAAAHCDELLQAADAVAKAAVPGTRECVRGPTSPQRLAVAEQRVALVHADEFRIGDPRGLYKFELPRDIGVEADEPQAPRLTLRFAFDRLLRLELGAVFAPAAQDTMKAC